VCGQHGTPGKVAVGENSQDALRPFATFDGTRKKKKRKEKKKTTRRNLSNLTSTPI
jgi:hypothetical protein